jgi:hypothetical protein
MIGLYNAHVEKSKRITWKRIVHGSKTTENTKSFIQTLSDGPRIALQNLPIWKQQIEKSLASLAYNTEKRKQGKID